MSSKTKTIGSDVIAYDSESGTVSRAVEKHLYNMGSLERGALLKQAREGSSRKTHFEDDEGNKFTLEYGAEGYKVRRQGRSF